MTMSEAVKEFRFIYFLLESLGVSVSLPIVVSTNNTVAIFMAENASSGVQTRHIDTRHHFICEHIEDGFIMVIFVRTEEIDADIITNNVIRENYDLHVVKFLGMIMED